MDRKVSSFVNKLLALSFSEGKLSTERVHAILAYLKQNSRRNYKQVLEVYLRKLRGEFRKETIFVQTAAELDAEILEIIKTNFEKSFQKRFDLKVLISPELLAGIKISLGDDVWDSSAQGKLQNLAHKFVN